MWADCLQHPFHVGGPQRCKAGDRIRRGQHEGRLATSHLPSGGSSTLHSGGENQKRPTRGRIGYILPAMWALGARLKPNVVPAKLFQCSRLSGRNKKSSKFIYPPTKPTRTWWQNMLFASLGGPRWYAHICCPARCHVKKTCFQKQFLLEHHWNTAGTSYWNVAGTSTLQQEQSTRKGKMVTYIVV